jgi:hypothetical protein
LAFKKAEGELFHFLKGWDVSIDMNVSVQHLQNVVCKNILFLSKEVRDEGLMLKQKMAALIKGRYVKLEEGVSDSELRVQANIDLKELEENIDNLENLMKRELEDEKELG